jgi:hypothetical protein
VDAGVGTQGRLQPTRYHRQVSDRLRRLEPELLDGVARAEVDAEALHSELLRSAYRLEPSAHPELAAALARAGEPFAAGVPVSVYQLEGVSDANASLVHLPDEAILTLSGNLLNLLEPAELTAVLGHELAHRELWRSALDLELTDRALRVLAADAGTPVVYLETARRWNLATELYADRGALLACGDLAVTVRALVKTATGLAGVDAEAYLRQAEAADPLRGSGGRSHPETVLRAWALARWAGGGGDEAVDALLRPGLDLDALDLLDQQQLAALTRNLITALLVAPELRTEAVLALARQYFPDFTGETVDDAVLPPDATAETRRYLAYVLLDLAVADPDLEDRGLAAALRLGRRLGVGEEFAAAARLEKVVPARTLTALLTEVTG